MEDIEKLKREYGGEYPNEIAAKIIKVHPATLNKWRVTGKGPKFVKKAGRIYYLQHHIDEWHEDIARRSTSEKPKRVA